MAPFIPMVTLLLCFLHAVFTPWTWCCLLMYLLLWTSSWWHCLLYDIKWYIVWHKRSNPTMSTMDLWDDCIFPCYIILVWCWATNQFFYIVLYPGVLYDTTRYYLHHQQVQYYNIFTYIVYAILVIVKAGSPQVLLGGPGGQGTRVEVSQDTSRAWATSGVNPRAYEQSPEHGKVVQSAGK